MVNSNVESLSPYLHIRKHSDPDTYSIYYYFEFNNSAQYAFQNWSNPDTAPVIITPEGNKYHHLTITVVAVGSPLRKPVIPHSGVITIKVPDLNIASGLQLEIKDQSGTGGGGGKSTAHYPDAE